MTHRADPALVMANHGNSSAKVRLFGGHVVSARVINPRTQKPQELLYAGQDLTDPKLRASHFGCPAGADGFGISNKHGATRYADHEIRISEETDHLVLRANLGKAAIGVTREVILDDNSVGIMDTVTNLRPPSGGESEETSLLSHLYLRRGSVTPSSEHPITLNGETIDDTLREKGAAQRIVDGTPHLWTGFADINSAMIGMPDGSRIELTASINGEPVDGALLWAPPGEDAFCVEPVVGLTDESNRGYVIPAGSLGMLVATIEAV